MNTDHDPECVFCRIVSGDAPAHRIWEDAEHLAARAVARRLDAAFEDVARTGIMYEGYGVDHAHAKLFPMHGTAGNQGEEWREVASAIEGYFDRYQGYLSSHDHTRADDAHLSEVAEHIRKTTV